MELDGILHRFPSLDGDMGHAEQVIDGLTEGFWIHFIKASDHPLKLRDDGQWHEDRRRFHHHAPRTRPLPLGFRSCFQNDIDGQLVVRDTQEPELKRAALTADYATVLNEATARTASETEDALQISAAAGTPSLTAGGSAQQNQGSSRCGTPPAASAGFAQSVPGPETGEARDRVEDLRPESSLALPRRDGVQHGGLEGVDLGVGMPPREDESAGVERAEHGGHLW